MSWHTQSHLIRLCVSKAKLPSKILDRFMSCCDDVLLLSFILHHAFLKSPSMAINFPSVPSLSNPNPFEFNIFSPYLYLYKPSNSSSHCNQIEKIYLMHVQPLQFPKPTFSFLNIAYQKNKKLESILIHTVK